MFRFISLLVFLAHHVSSETNGNKNQPNNLRRGQNQRILQDGNFEHNAIIEAADELYCTPGEYTQDYALNITLDHKGPIAVAPEDQCASACDCKMRCCSNNVYYILTESAYEPGNPGGVCVEIPEIITDAAEQSCAYGFVNINATMPPTSEGQTPEPTQGQTPEPTPSPDDKPAPKPTPKPDDKPVSKPTPKPDVPKPDVPEDKPVTKPTPKPDVPAMSMRRLDNNWLDDIADLTKDTDFTTGFGGVSVGKEKKRGGLDRKLKKRNHRILRENLMS